MVECLMTNELGRMRKKTVVGYAKICLEGKQLAPRSEVLLEKSSVTQLLKVSLNKLKKIFH